MRHYFSRINPALVLSLLGLLFIALATVLSTEAKPGVKPSFKSSSTTSASAERDIEMDPKLKSEIFADATELLVLMRSVGLDRLSDLREAFKAAGPESADLVLKRNGFTPLNTHGDVGIMLATLLAAKEAGFGSFSAEELRELYKSLKAKEAKLENVALTELFQEWKRSLSSDLKMSNNESMQFRSLMKKPW